MIKHEEGCIHSLSSYLFPASSLTRKETIFEHLSLRARKTKLGGGVKSHVLQHFFAELGVTTTEGGVQSSRPHCRVDAENCCYAQLCFCDTSYTLLSLELKKRSSTVVQLTLMFRTCRFS